MDKIIIEVSQGLVQAVYSNNPDIEVKILDWDKDSAELTEEEKELQQEIQQMKDIL